MVSDELLVFTWVFFLVGLGIVTFIVDAVILILLVLVFDSFCGV